ncbi:MAG: hypothetical protein U0354_01780 [Candidatus Sericytochromatia bacterium]
MRKNLIVLSLLMCPSLLTLVSCTNPTTGNNTNPAGTILNNIGNNIVDMFVPKADLFITRISSTDLTKGVSIIQKFQAVASLGTNTALYTFNEPNITIENRPGLPRVVFKQMIVQYTVNGQQLPSKKVPIGFTVPRGGSFAGPVPLLISSEDLLNAVFPNNSPTTVQTALAQATLLGVDDNDNLVSLNFTTPVRFESDLSGFVRSSATPSPSPSPSP